MTLYSIYEPGDEQSNLAARADRIAFVKEGFSWPALFFPALWLIFHRMWIELIVLLIAFAALQWLYVSSVDGRAVLEWAGFALVLLFAFEANDLRGFALVRRGYQPVGVAMGEDRETAELSFFRSWFPRQSGLKVREGGKPRPAQGPTRLRPSEGEEVIGLFPRP